MLGHKMTGSLLWQKVPEYKPFCAARFEVPTVMNIKIIAFQDWQKGTNVSEEPAASIFRIEMSAIWENEGKDTGNRSVSRLIRDGSPQKGRDKYLR
jgi:hypothetical protein